MTNTDANAFAAVLEHYLAKMRAREPMAMYRFGDGEMMLVDGEAVGEHTQASRVDRWSAPARKTQLGRDLATVLSVQEPWAHFGIPCPCCNEAGYQRLNATITKSPKFPANLFINANYPRWRRFLREELADVPVAFVYNERGSGVPDVMTQPPMYVPDDCVNRYEAERAGILGQARAFARSLKPRSLVLVSAGPLSEVLIFTMWNEVPNHCYVDVGSALDEWTHGTKTRPYMESGTHYATKECPLPESRPSDPSPWASRFVRRSDPYTTRVFVDLPQEWWSRGHEYGWCMQFAESGHVVLDAACGLSHPFKMWLADHGCETHACDLDPAVLEPETILGEIKLHLGAVAEERVRSSGILARIRVDQANLVALPYGDKTFDRVFCISVLEHVVDLDRRACLREFGRVLKPDGLVVVTMDVPPIDPTVFAADVAASGLAFAAEVDPEQPGDALVGTPPGYGTLRCFRALLRKATPARVSIIINTVCGDAEASGRHNEYRSAVYSERADLLRRHVLPRCVDFDEVIVAGVFPADLQTEFPRVHFVEVPPVRRNRWDALHQRDVGARYATGDIVVFCHDDHAPGETLAERLRSMPETTDILVPKRIHLKTGQELINGRERAGMPPYMGGHCYAMRRWIWAALPLTGAPDEYWDIVLTPMWQKLGARIVWDDSVVHYDCEATEAES